MSLLQTIPSRMVSLGGMKIRRVLPHVKRRMVGPFIFMDQGGPLRIPNEMAGGIPEHPHAGLSTFTYLMEGSVLHRDSAGYRAHIRSGDVALMTSGSGITHEEIPIAQEGAREHRMFMAQMWLALPDEHEDMAPTFEHHQRPSLPVYTQPNATARIAMGQVWGKSAPTTCYVPTFYTEIRLRSGMLELRADYDEHALYILSGDASLSGNALEPHTLYVWEKDAIRLSSPNGCHGLYFGGDRFTTPRWIGGNFVASSREKLLYWIQRSQTPYWPHIRR